MFRESLKTWDFELAKRKLRDFLNRVGKMAPGMGKIAFAQVLERWKEVEFNPKDLKPWSRRYRELCIEGIKQCHMAISGACKKLGFPRFGHHSMRHFFTSNAIEQGIDFKTVAAWLGHKDGGVLVAQVYGHLREEHSEAMAAKMTFDATAAPANVVAFQQQVGG